MSGCRSTAYPPKGWANVPFVMPGDSIVVRARVRVLFVFVLFGALCGWQLAACDQTTGPPSTPSGSSSGTGSAGSGSGQTGAGSSASPSASPSSAASGEFTFVPSSTASSPLVVTSAAPVVVTVSPAVSTGGAFSVANSNQLCASVSESVSGATLSQFTIAAAAGATTGCTGAYYVSAGGYTVGAYYIVQ